MAASGATPPAVFLCPMESLKNRADFLRANRGRRQVTPGFILLARHRKPGEGDGSVLRVGYTCSKKLGNAVARNRAKRRLREIARAHLPKLGRAGWDYVLIGRPNEAESRQFPNLSDDLKAALNRIHGDQH